MTPWSEVRTFEELCAVNIRFLRGELPESPGHGGPPDPETSEIQDALIELNRRGFLTTESQPGTIFSPHAKQRAYVTGLAKAPVAADIAARELYSDLIVLRFQPVADALAASETECSTFRITATVDEGCIYGALGLPEWDDLARFMEICPHIRTELIPLWSIQILDPQWGRKKYLWDTLLQPAQEGFVARWRDEEQEQ